MAAVNLAKTFPLDAMDEGVPVKRVKDISDMEAWQNSIAYFDLLGFINGISNAIQGKRITDDIFVSETLQNLINIFDKLDKYIDETPPITQPQRFGNKSFRSWSRKMNHDIFVMLQKALPQEKCHLFTELGIYLSESFGNAVRIDYGTGHEMSFVFFMCALFKAEILKEEDNIASVLRLFNTYLKFVRRLQQVYRMEPAGSQGVWSLDDYQFLPFIWGSAQLAANTPFEPAKFIDNDIIEKYKNDYLYISCIDYIREVKTGHFAEHSNQLWSISAVPTWSKINSGLVKMYQKEIMCKFPIIQHTFFGQLMPFKPAKPGAIIRAARLGFVPQTKIPPNKKNADGAMAPPPNPPQVNQSGDSPQIVPAVSCKLDADDAQCERQKDEVVETDTKLN